MLKTLVIVAAIMIAVVNLSAAQVAGTTKKHVPRKASFIRVGPSTTYLKAGFSLEEVLRLLGEPVAISQRQSGSELVTTYEFRRGQKRFVIAEFVNGALVSSRTETREQVAQTHR